MSQEKQTADEIRYAIIKKNQRNIENNDNDEGITIVYDYHATMEEYATLKLQEQAKEIERLKGEKWIDVSIEPQFGGEYNVVYDLEDGGELVVSTMDYDKTTKLWMDTRGANIPIFTVKKWQELPPIN